MWPTDNSQLIPYGLEASVYGYVASLRLYRDCRFQDTLNLMANILLTFGAPVIQYVLDAEPDWALRVTLMAHRVLTERKETLGQTITWLRRCAESTRST